MVVSFLGHYHFFLQVLDTLLLRKWIAMFMIKVNPEEVKAYYFRID